VRGDLTTEDLNDLARRAGLKDFLDNSPQGWDSPVRDLGSNLSLGTRRRLALARALVSEKRLYLIDEPSEGLDSEGAALVQRAMIEAVKSGATVIAFSHDAGQVLGARFALDLNQKPQPKVVPLDAERASPAGRGGLRPVAAPVDQEAS